VPASVIVQDTADGTIVPSMVHLAGLVLSAGAKPLPVTVTVVPTGPEVGLSVMEGALTTVKSMEAESPVLPAT
jgi:hypothetical protein